MQKVLFFIFLSLFVATNLAYAEEESMLEKYKKMQQKDIENYQKRVDKEEKSYEIYVRAERKAWRAYVNKVQEKWGDYVDSKPKSWAEYGKDLNSLSIVDYGKNKIKLEAISMNRSPKKARIEAKKLFKKRFKKIIKQKDKSTKTKILEDHLKIKDEPVTEENSDQFIEEQIEKNLKEEVVVGKDGKARTKYVLTLDMVPNSIQIRAKKYFEKVKKYSKEYNLDPALILALIHTESAFNPKAFSRRPDGTPMACGLMQIIPTQAGRDAHKALWGKDKIVKPEFLYDADNNLKMGTWYFNSLIKFWKRQDKRKNVKSDKDKLEYYSISSYNQGMGTIRKKAYYKHKLYEKSADETYRVLNTEKSISKEGRDYIEKVVKRKKLYRKEVDA